MRGGLLYCAPMRWGPATLVLCSCFYVTEAERMDRFDLDSDGIERPFDCDDEDPGVGEVATRYRDEDGDGYGDPEAGVAACGAEPGTVTDDTDCNDGSPLTHPGAPERCDGDDNDCDSEVDEGQSEIEWFRDDDGDGYGDDADTVVFCSRPEGYSAEGRDCDDADEDVNPDATEVCGGVDEDCDDLVDEDDPDLEPTTWYRDGDGDGFGAVGTGVAQCEAPTDHVVNDADCDDTDSVVNPDAEERCTPFGLGAVDENCDGVFDLDAVDRLQYYADADGDGFGNASAPVDACPPAKAGLATNPSDCDDVRDDVYPEAPECDDGVDNDCDPGTVGAPC